MSWWINGKDKRELWGIDVEIGILIIPVVIIAAIVIPNALLNPAPFMYTSIGMVASGVVGVFTAKLSLFRRGIWVSWGPRQMSKAYAGLYVVGYALIGVGLLLMLVMSKIMSAPGRVL